MPLVISVKKPVEKYVNRKIKNLPYVAMHQQYLVLIFGPIVVKRFSITVKKALVKYLSRKFKKYILCNNAPAMAHVELWDKYILALIHYREEGSRKISKQKN
jgi:hypothetical protein